MADSGTLYDELILDHIKNARNYRAIDSADRRAEGVNPLCGDNFNVYVKLDGEVIREASFQCSCCGISMASASVMTEEVIGKTVQQARELYKQFIGLIFGADRTAEATDLKEAAVLCTVREFPSRRNCAALAWHTLAAALDGRSSRRSMVSPDRRKPAQIVPAPRRTYSTSSGASGLDSALPCA
jgi:nitrogen fixation NifU-like protein